MIRNTLGRWLAAMALVAASVPAAAAPGPQTTEDQRTPKEGMTDQAKTLTRADVVTLAFLHDVNRHEIALGELAEQRATKPAIKSYATMLVTDHTRSDRQLAAFAKARGTTIDKIAETSAANASNLDEGTSALRKLYGNEFDRQFVDAMVAGHLEAITRVDADLAKVSPDLATLLRATRPVLQRHEDLAIDLDRKNAQASR